MSRESSIPAYRRADGRVGVRNHVLVLGTNGLAVRASERIARMVPGALCVAATSGRGQVEPDLEAYRTQLAGLATNPNVGGVLVVGVDAETAEHYLAAIRATGTPAEAVSFAACAEDALAVVDRGNRLLAQLARRASRCRREPARIAELTVAVECGHSDATSGIAANRVVGAAVDRLLDAGATVLVGETVEWLGAEHLLARRARDTAVGEAIVQAVARREAVARDAGHSLLGNNPGEENIAGGLSTIEEKSLGAVVKSGSRPIDGLLGLTDRPPGPGLYLMDGPAFSPESMTGFAAAGAQLMLFTTGPGNSYASAVAPTIKVTARADTARLLTEQIDFDASGVFSGEEDAEGSASRLVDLVADVAGGSRTWGEILGEGLEVPTRLRGSL